MEFPDSSAVKNPPAMQEMLVRSLGRKDRLKKEMAAHLSVLAWRIPHKGALQATGVAKELDTTYQLNNVLYTL